MAVTFVFAVPVALILFGFLVKCGCNISSFSDPFLNPFLDPFLGPFLDPFLGPRLGTMLLQYSCS